MAAPPRPYFQPQPNWGGQQYFRAQLGNNYDDYDDLRDEGFFDNVWRGIKDIFSRGFSREDANLWHRRVYSGQVPIDQLDAAQLGAAAGFEAVRQWSTYKSTYRSPLADDRDREKEALAGLAVGEAMKLLSYSSRARSRHTRREAAEIAAATAERIFAEDFDDPYEVFESNPYRRRRNSVLRRRSSSFGYGATRPPLVASTTGGSYVSAQPTGVSYVSSASTGAIPYAQSSGGIQYAGGQQTYVSAATGQPVQYVQAGSPYGSAYGTAGGYVQAQPTYVSANGQPLQYATTGQAYTTAGQAYTTAGQAYGQQVQYVQQPGYQYATSTGYGQPAQQVVYAQGAQPAQYIAAPQGYTRARALSTGYSTAPGYVQY